MKSDKIEYIEDWAVVAITNYEYYAKMIRDTLVEGGIDSLVARSLLPSLYLIT